LLSFSQPSSGRKSATESLRMSMMKRLAFTLLVDPSVRYMGKQGVECRGM
jgi:hypothetical protein